VHRVSKRLELRIADPARGGGRGGEGSLRANLFVINLLFVGWFF
jgi:hypothetical protein